jgi:hypothetical protein
MILSVPTARSSSKLCQGTQRTPASNLAGMRDVTRSAMHPQSSYQAAISRSACSQSAKSLPSAAPEKKISYARMAI